MNTNVLYYTGTVSANAANGQNKLPLYIENAANICDMADNIGSYAGSRYYANVYVTYYDAALNGTNVTDITGFGAVVAGGGNSWTGTIKAADGYTLPTQIDILVDGFILSETAYEYDKETGIITIPKEYVTGNIKVVAVGVSKHTHDWKYSVGDDAKTITAECIGAYTCNYTGTDKSITINAPEMKTYADGNSANASLSASSIAGQTTLPAIKYVGKDATAYAQSTTAPTNAGKYTASITIGGATASVDYEIAKAEPTVSWPADLIGNAGEKLSTINLPDGFTWINPNLIIDYGRKDYAMRYQPSDTNYKYAEAVVRVEVKDNNNPTGTISIGDKTWSSFIEKENISFDVFYNTKQTVKITAEDESYGSGVDEVYYYLSTGAKTKNELTNMALSSWIADVYEFNIQANRKYIIYVRILDEKSNETIISTDGIVIDSKAPVISGITDGETYFGDTEVTVSDDYFDKVEINGIETAVTDGKFTVKPASDTQKIIAYDKAGNTTTCNITVTAPEIMICEQSVAGSGTSYEYSFTMMSPDEVGGTFIVALYSGSRLVGLKTITMDNNSLSYLATNQKITTQSSADTYKIMFLSGLDTLTPLCEAADGNIAK